MTATPARDSGTTLVAWTVLICLAVVFGLLALEAMFA